MSDRTTLPYDVQRCAGRMSFSGGAAHWCKQRMSCQRYLAFTQWDREAGIPDYRWTPVAMATPNCQIKIEVSNDNQ